MPRLVCRLSCNPIMSAKSRDAKFFLREVTLQVATDKVVPVGTLEEDITEGSEEVAGEDSIT